MLVAIVVVVVVALIATGAFLLTTNSRLINSLSDRTSLLESVADGGLELARSRINGDPSIYPDSSYVALEVDAAVTDAGGTPIATVRRSTSVGPTGITSGQYGVFGSVVAVAEDDFGNVAIRRREIRQESFAQYAYFTDVEGNIWFGGGDQIWGPVHSNDRIRIHSTGAQFHGTVTTAADVYQEQYGTFDLGYTENATPIAMPPTAELTKLQSQASAGNMSIGGDTDGGQGEATTRIEFVALDLDGDGRTTGSNEGFIRVFQSADFRWVSGSVPADYNTNGMRNSENCGHYHGTSFVVADDHPSSGSDSWKVALASSSRRCYPGGSDSIGGVFQANDGVGEWLAWPGAVSPLVAGRPDGAYLWPITRELNPSFKGVIFVGGKVAIAGVVRGQVTLAATDDIVIIDDIRYATDPGSGVCADMLGLFAGDDVVLADNPLNAAYRRLQPGSSGNPYYTFDDTADEFVHGVVLALDVFTVENYTSGSTNAQPCGSQSAGRGCLFLTGGVIQRQRGAVGTTSGTGYIKRYSYDQCVLTQPPPYFPTTGHFASGRYYEIDPVGFDVGSLFQMLTPP